MSRHTGDVRAKLKLKGLAGAELENQVIMERSSAEDYGLTRGELVGAYTHMFNEELRRDGDSVDVNKVREINPQASEEPEEALKNCIGLKFFEAKGDLIYLKASGRMLVGKPFWQNPFSCKKEEKWNLQLIFEYIKALWPVWSIILLIIAGLIGYVLGKL